MWVLQTPLILRALQGLHAERIRGLLGRYGKRFEILLATFMKFVATIPVVLAFMFVALSVFAVMGVARFHASDPLGFGNYGRALMTLVRVVTLDRWHEPMLINVLGCQSYGSVSLP
jgi:hypothetical protein